MFMRRLMFAAGVLLAAALPAGAQTWVPTAGGTYTWNDPVNWSPNTVPLSGTSNVNNDITGDQTITLDTTPTLTALNIGDASAPLVAPGAFGFTITPGSGGAFTFGAGSTIASQNGANVISAPITLTGGLTVTHSNNPTAPSADQQAGSLTLSGPINLNANTLTVAQTTSSLGRLDRGVVIAGVISGSGGLTKSSGGFLNLTAANTYTGTTTISGGAVRLTGSGAIGPGNLTLSGGQFFPGAAFNLPIGSGNGQVQLTTGNTGFGTIGQDLTVNFGGAGGAVDWGPAGFTPTRFLLSSTSSDGTVTVVNPFNLNGAVREVQVDNGAASIDAVLSGKISGTAGSAFTKSGDGTLVLSGANTYPGETLVGSNGILRVQSDTGLGATGSGNHTRILGAARTNRVELAGGITTAEPFQIEGRNAGNLATALLGATGSNTLTGSITFNAGGVEYNVSVSTGNVFLISGNVNSTLGTGTNTRNLNLQGGVPGRSAGTSRTGRRTTRSP